MANAASGVDSELICLLSRRCLLVMKNFPKCVWNQVSDVCENKSCMRWRDTNVQLRYVYIYIYLQGNISKDFAFVLILSINNRISFGNWPFWEKNYVYCNISNSHRILHTQWQCDMTWLIGSVHMHLNQLRVRATSMTFILLLFILYYYLYIIPICMKAESLCYEQIITACDGQLPTCKNLPVYAISSFTCPPTSAVLFLCSNNSWDFS